MVRGPLKFGLAPVLGGGADAGLQVQRRRRLRTGLCGKAVGGVQGRGLGASAAAQLELPVGFGEPGTKTKRDAAAGPLKDAAGCRPMGIAVSDNRR